MEITFTTNVFGKHVINLEVWFCFYHFNLGIINYQSNHNYNQSNPKYNYNLFSLIYKLSSNKLYGTDNIKGKSFLKIIVEYVNKKETKKTCIHWFGDNY
jgi:hypothetical protein